MTAGTKAHKAAREAARTQQHASVGAVDVTDAPAVAPAGMPAITLVETQGEIIADYAGWRTRDLARDLPTYLAGAIEFGRAGELIEFVAAWREVARRAIALSCRPDMPTGYPIGRYLVAPALADGAPAPAHVCDQTGTGYVPMGSRPECRFCPRSAAEHAPAPAAEAADQGAQGDTVPAPAPAADWSNFRPLCEQTGSGFRPHSRRPWECGLCGRPDTAHRVMWVRRDDGRPVLSPSQVDIVRGDVVRAPAPAAEAADQGAQGDTVPAPAPAAEAADQGMAGTVPATDQGEKIMKATVNRADLVTALAYVARGIGRPSVPVLSGTVLTVADGTLTVHTFNWETLRAADLVAEDSMAGMVCVPGKPLAAFVKKLPKKVHAVDLVASAGNLTVSADGLSATFDGLGDEIPPLPAVGHVIGTVAAGTLADLVGRVAPAAGTDETVPSLTAVRVRTEGSSIDVTATDRYRLHAAAGAWQPAEESPGFLVAPASEYAVPAAPLKEFAALAGAIGGDVTVTVGECLAGGMAAASYGLACGGYRVLATCIDGYPAVDGIWPATHNGTVTVRAADLVALVGRVTINADKKEKLPLILRFDADQVTAEFGERSPDTGRPAATGSMPATIDGSVPEYVAANPAYLTGCVTALAAGAKDATVTMSTIDQLKPLIITSDVAAGARTLLMPIRATIGFPPHPFRQRPGVAGKCDILGCTAAENAPSHVRPAAGAADQGDTVPAPAPAAEASAEAPEEHAYAASVHNPNRCGECGAGRSARVHRAARQAERAEREARIAAGQTADVAPAPAVESVALVGPVVASVADVQLTSGTAVVANGSTLGYIASAKRRNRTDGFDLMTGGQYTTHYATRQVAPAVIGATVCATPYLAGCGCAGKLHVPARELRNLPRLADQCDQGDTVPAPAAEAADQGDTVPAPAVRPVVDGRDALAGTVTARAPESRPVAILPAGALDRVTSDPRPADFDRFREEIRLCECPLCRECAYNAHHWCDRRDQVHAARVLLAHLMAGTHERQTLAERSQESRAHRADLVAVAEASGVTGEALDRIRDPHAYMVAAARAAKRDEFENGLGLGVTIGGTFGTARSREYIRTRAAEVARAAAAVPVAEAAAEAPALVVEGGDQGETGTAGSVPAEAPAVELPAVEAPAASLVFPDTADQGDSVPAPAPAPAAEASAEAPASTLQGAHPQMVYVSEHGTFAGYRFHVAPLTPVKALAKSIRKTIGAERAALGGSFHVTAPAGTRTVNIAPKDGQTVADWSPVLARVAELIGAALVDGECTACDQEAAVAE